jgi:thiol:disulfide interchange protein DsbC
MLREQPAASATGGCDATALSRNVELGRKYKINGTPTLLFVNGSRVPGAVDAKKVEQMLSQAAKG